MGFPMAWTDIARAEHDRDRLRFPSDLTDREWAIVEPMIPGAKRGGRPRTTDMRDVMEAILVIASSGCPWRMPPGKFPPVSTVRGGGVCGDRPGKKIKGRKRHIITDPLGFLIFVRVHRADIQDRDGAPDLLRAIRFRHPWLRHVFADGGYAGGQLKDAPRGHGRWTSEIVKRSDTAKGFVILPRRRVVERTCAGRGRCRRLAKDCEKSIESATAFAHIASIRMPTRPIPRHCKPA
jgi:putative transposase